MEIISWEKTTNYLTTKKESEIIKMVGIYKITNNINGHSYIGLSTNLEDRWKYHLTPYNQERESYKTLYKAFKKYGVENFSFEILEECSI